MAGGRRYLPEQFRSHNAEIPSPYRIEMPAPGLDKFMLDAGLLQSGVQRTGSVERSIVRADSNPEQFQSSIRPLGIAQDLRMPRLEIGRLS